MYPESIAITFQCGYFPVLSEHNMNETEKMKITIKWTADN